MAEVIAVAAAPGHGFSKDRMPAIRLVAGLGVVGDAHAGETVKHRSRVARDPGQPNLRQVHLLQSELLDRLNRDGFGVRPGDLGENVTTRGLDLLALPAGALLRLGEAVVLEVTGLRNPCAQIDRFRAGLLAAVLEKRADGSLVRKAGIMAVVRTGGEVRPGDPVTVEPPPPPHRPLEPV